MVPVKCHLGKCSVWYENSVHVWGLWRCTWQVQCLKHVHSGAWLVVNNFIFMWNIMSVLGSHTNCWISNLCAKWYVEKIAFEFYHIQTKSPHQDNSPPCRYWSWLVLVWFIFIRWGVVLEPKFTYFQPWLLSFPVSYLKLLKQTVFKTFSNMPCLHAIVLQSNNRRAGWIWDTDLIKLHAWHQCVKNSWSTFLKIQTGPRWQMSVI